MSDPRSPFSADPLTERVAWTPASHGTPVFVPSVTPALAPDTRRPVRPGLLLGAVLATALFASGATYVAVHASDAGRAPDPAAATAPAAVAGSSASPAVGSTAPRASSAPAATAGGQPVARPWLGIHVVTLDPAIAQANNLPVDTGAWITASTAGSGNGSTSGSSASQDPNAESSPGTDTDGEGDQATDPSAESSPRTDADGESQAPAGQAPKGGAQAGDAVVPGGPADRAGLRAGDIITAVDGTALDATHRLDQVLGGYAAGETVRLDVLRDGQPMTLSVTIGTRPANP
jgi:membrane-associated protease RseP (regulator of RpoE activity)